MSTAVDEIVTKINELKDSDRAELLSRLNESEPKNGEPKKPRMNGKKGYVSPNTIWVKEHHAEYAGNYVALKNGELVAYGRTIKEADQKAKAKGVNDSLLTYLFPLDEIPWGGW
jgi:hypothetical protein